MVLPIARLVLVHNVRFSLKRDPKIMLAIKLEIKLTLFALFALFI